MALFRASRWPSGSLLVWHSILAFTFLAGALVRAGTGEVTVLPTPSWVRNCDWVSPTNQPSTSQSGGTRYLVYERQDLTVLAQDYTRLVLLMENETGVQDYGNLRFRFDPSYQTLQLHSVRIHRAGIILNRLDQSKIRVIQPEPGLSDGVLTGDKAAVVLIEDLRVGDVLEYAFTLAGADPVLAGHYSRRLAAQSSVPIEHQRFRIIWPTEKPLAYRQSTGVRPPAIESRESLTEYWWQWENLSAIPYEDLVPPGVEVYPMVELSDFTNWASVVQWGAPMYVASKTSLPSELLELIDKWKEQPSAELRAREAVQFLQNEVRYTGLMDGLGSHHPASPAETFQKRYGDCKGKAFLLCAILQQMNIQAWPALVSYSLREGVTRCQPSPFVFDHVIVKINLQGTSAWVDATRSQQGGDLLHRNIHRFGYALVLAEGTTDLEVPSGHLYGGQHVTSTFRFQDYTNPATLQVLSVYSGWKAEEIRSYLHQKDTQKLATDYLNFYAKYYPGIRLKAPARIEDDLDSDVMRVTEFYEIPNMWKSDPKAGRDKAEFYAESMMDMLPEPTVRMRTLPLQIVHPLDFSHRTLVNMPDSQWTIPAAQEKVRDDAFTFDCERRSTPSQVEFIHRCTTLTDEVPVMKQGVYLENVSRMENLLGNTLYIAGTGVSNAPTVNWFMVSLMLVCMVAAGLGSIWIWRSSPSMPPLPPATPEDALLTGLGGWLIFVGFRVCTSPIIMAGALVRDWHSNFSIETWNWITSQPNALHNVMAGSLAVFQVATSSIELTLSILCLALFFAKRHAFKVVFISVMVVGIVGLLATEIGAGLIPVYKDSGNTNTTLGQVFGTIIWSMYMVRSRRVQLTFTR